jgi:hypothetical protein
MKNFFQILYFCIILIALSSCVSTKQLTIKTIEPSPVDFSSQITRIGIVNNSKSSFVKSYSTKLEQLIVMEEKWLSDKGTEAALTGLFDELAQDKRFDEVRILENLDEDVKDFGRRPSNSTWRSIAKTCQENGVDAIFALASHDTHTEFSLKKTKIDQLDMMRERTKISGQEITLETLIENGWRIYDPKNRVLIDEFTSNDQIVSSAKGLSPVDALQAIDNRRESLLNQSKNSGSAYGQRMLPQKRDVQRNYYVLGSRNLTLADDKIQEGAYQEAVKLLEDEIANGKPRMVGRACHNLAVLNEFNGNINAAMNWANKSYEIIRKDATLVYISELERRKAQTDVLKFQMANTSFEAED